MQRSVLADEWNVALKPYYGYCGMLPIARRIEFVQKLQLFEEEGQSMYDPRSLDSTALCDIVWYRLQELMKFAPKDWDILINKHLQQLGRRFHSAEEFDVFVTDLTEQEAREKEKVASVKRRQEEVVEARKLEKEYARRMGRAKQLIKRGNFTLEGGVYSFSQYYHPKWDMEVINFGELHASPRCDETFGKDTIIDMPDFLKVWFDEHESQHKDSKSPPVIDFFLEVPFQPKTADTISRHGLRQKAEPFKKCFVPNKRNCPYKTIRFHYADVRYVQENLMDLITQIVGEFASNDWYTSPQQLNYILRPFTKQKHIRAVFDQLKITKQFNAIRFPGVARTLLRYFLTNIQERARQLLRFVPHQKLEQDKMADEYHKFHALFMDAYLMGRMFRHFDAKGPRRIVLYSGGMHADTYSDVLERLGFKEERRILTRMGLCLDVTDPIAFRPLQTASFKFKSKSKSKKPISKKSKTLSKSRLR